MATRQKRTKPKKKEREARLHDVLLAGIALSIFVLPLFIWPGLTDYNYAKTIASLVMISGLLVLWGLNMGVGPSRAVHVPWVVAAAAGVVLAGLLSMIHATNGRVAIQSLVLLLYYILLLWMIADQVRTRREVCWLLIAAVASAALAALYGLLQYFGVLLGKSGRSGVTAILSTLGNRNHLGALLLYLFFPGVLAMLKVRTWWAKTALLVTLVFNLAVMLLIHQAGSQLTLAAIAVFLAIGIVIFRPFRALRKHRLWLLALAGVIAILAVAVVVIPPAPKEAVDPDIELADETATDTSLILRMWAENSGPTRELLWSIGARMLMAQPATGAGLGNYKIDYYPVKYELLLQDTDLRYDFHVAPASQAHNEFVQVGAELGIFGLVMFCSALIVLAVSLWRRIKQADASHQLDLLLLTAGILAILVHSLVSFPAHVVSSSLAFVLLCGLALAPAYGQEATLSWHPRRWQVRSLQGVFLILAIVITAFALADARADWLMERGIDQVQTGQYAAAEATLQRSLKLDFAPRQTYYFLAVAQIQLGELDSAAENLDRCMTRFLDEVVYLAYAEIQTSFENYADAQKAVDIVLAGHPLSRIDERARYIEATIAIKERAFDRAIQLLESLALDHESYELAYITLGQLYSAQGLTNSAKRNYQAAIAAIDEKLRIAQESLASVSSTGSVEAVKLRAEIDQLLERREYALSQMSSSP